MEEVLLYAPNLIWSATSYALKLLTQSLRKLSNQKQVLFSKARKDANGHLIILLHS